MLKAIYALIKFTQIYWDVFVYDYVVACKIY
jgi:hypothetical protein